MKDTQEMPRQRLTAMVAKLKAMRYGKPPKQAARKKRRLSKQLGLTIDCMELKKLTVHQKFEAGGHSFREGGMALVNKERREPIISRQNIAFIAPYHHQ